MTLQDMIDYEKKESFDDGVALGRQEDRAEGIIAFISLARELNVPTDQLSMQLMEKFSLTKDEANAYLTEN